MSKINKKLKRARGHKKKIKYGSDQPRPSSLQCTLQQAQALHHAGRLPQAEALYRQILQIAPNNPEALHCLGILAHEGGKSDAAAELISQALILNPDYAEAHYNLGNALRAQGKWKEAADSYHRAVTLKPDYVEARFNLGILFHLFGKLDLAEASFRKVLALKQDFAGAHNNLGIVLQNQKKPEEAEVCFLRVIALKPDFAEAHNNLGNALHAQGKPKEAEASYRRAIALKPDYVEALTNLGIELHSQGHLDEAEVCYRRALTLMPEYVDAHNNLGMTLEDQGKLHEAIASFRRVLSFQPEFSEAHSNLLLCLNYLPDQSPSLYIKEARKYGEQTRKKVKAPFFNWNCIANPERLRVGMVSGDFRNHSVGYFLENLLVNFDPTRIDLIAYPTTRIEDELTTRIRSYFVGWQPLAGMDDATAARLIHDSGVHVLLDLAGHTNHNRLPVFAWKPAPIQVSWLGYSASTGLSEIDYLLADPIVAQSREEAHYTETIWRLPESYLCFSPPQQTVEVGSLPAFKEGRITFGCFNNPTKMNDAVVALWVKVLHAVPDSRLFLKSKRFSTPSFCEATRKRFAVFGIPSERLLLEGFVLKREEHLAAYNRVDIALDPFPYNGTTTSAEGLWMGVPFITRRGDRFISRVGESINRNTGMNDWIAMDDMDYIEKAKSYASDLEALARLRASLRNKVKASPLFNGSRFARDFEEALWEMWRCHKKFSLI